MKWFSFHPTKNLTDHPILEISGRIQEDPQLELKWNVEKVYIRKR